MDLIFSCCPERIHAQKKDCHYFYKKLLRNSFVNCNFANPITLLVINYFIIALRKPGLQLELLWFFFALLDKKTKDPSLLFSLSLLVLFSVENKAQEPYTINYTIKDGLPSNEVFDLIQDKKGFIWISTDKGVSRYDGYKFENFTSAQGLIENVVLGFHEDETGKIWFRSFTNRLCFFYEGKIWSFEGNDELVKLTKGGVICSMHGTKDTLYLGFERCPFLYAKYPLHGRNKKLLIIKANPQLSPPYKWIKEFNHFFLYGAYHAQNPIPANSTTSFSSAIKSTPASQKKLLYFKRDGKATQLLFTSPSYYGRLFSRILRLKNGHYLITDNSSVYQFNTKTETIVALTDYLDYCSLSALEDKDGAFWVATLKGLKYYPDHNLNKQPLTFFSNKIIGSILQDNEGGLWVSTSEKGLFYIQQKHILNFFANSLHQSDKIYGAGVGNEGQIWLSTNKGTAFLIKKGKITSLDSNYIKRNKISYIPGLKVYNNAAYLFSDNKFFQWDSAGNIKPSEPHEKNTNRSGNGFHINPLTGKVYYLSYFHFEESAGASSKNIIINPNDRIYNMETDAKNRLWLALLNGIKVYDQYKEIDLTHKWPELKTRINDIKISPGQYVWIATKSHGLYLMKDSTLHHFSNSAEFPADICNSIFIEADFSVWVSTNKGVINLKLSGFNPLHFTTKIYSTNEGLPSNQVNHVFLRKDTVYAVYDEGVSFFNPKKLEPNISPPPVYISSFSCTDSSFSVSDTSVLKYHQNALSIHYIGLSYKTRGIKNYRYRLLGLDSTWKYTSASSINYSPLPPGSYSFEVLLCNNDGYWSAKPAIKHFIIQKPFWLEWWFIVIVLVLFIILLRWFILFRVNKIRIREEEKTALYKKAAASEKEKAEFFQKAVDMELRFLSAQMNPHFTFNALTSIQNFILHNDAFKANNYLGKYSRLIRLVLENNMQTSILLSKEIELLKLYIELERMRFDMEIDYSISVDEAIDINALEIPPLVLQPYIENALWHGLSHKKSGKGEINIALFLKEQGVICAITDNGVGRKQSSMLKGNTNSQRSYGIFITQERLKHLHSSTSPTLRPEIEDLYNEKGNACGTKVTLVLPHFKSPV